MIENKIFAMRMIKYQETNIVNICDLELLGKNIHQNDFTIHISEDYYHDEEIGEQDAIKILKASSITNLVGDNIVNLALDLKLAKENSIKRIENIPFLMIFNFRGNY